MLAHHFREVRLAAQQLPGFCERHAEKLQHGNLSNPRQIRFAVQTIARARARRRPQQADAVVMAQRPHGHARESRELLDSVRRR